MPKPFRHQPAAWLVASSLVSSQVLMHEALGDTAKLLPPGTSHLRYQYTAVTADRYFDSGGSRRSLGAVYREALAHKGLSTVPGVYHVDTDGEFSQIRQDLYFEYGISSSLNFGAWVHHINQRLDYSATLWPNSGWSNLSADIQAGVEDAIGMADAGADSSASAWGDTVLGVKHRLIGEDNDAPLRFTYTLGVRLPTGHVADPLKPGDRSIGDGQTDAGIWLAWDWEPNDRWLLNLYTRHEYQFKGEQDAAVTETRKLPREFQPGIYHYVELFAEHTIPGARFNSIIGLKTIYELEGTVRAQQYDAAAGRYRGDLKSMDDSESMLFRLEPQVGFNLYPIKIPVSALLYYSRPLSGKNTLAAEYIGLRWDLFW